MGSEIRKDYLLNRWVILAVERAKRPTDFKRSQLEEMTDIKNCPFCPGNEEVTPPSLLSYVTTSEGVKKDRDSDGRRVKNWLVRCITNLYPAVETREIIPLTEDRLHCRKDGVGAHEVVIESPDHNGHPHNADLNQLELLINAYIDRLRSLSNWEYVSIFRNHKKEGGTSLSHAHSQIIATPIVPSLILEELNMSREYFKKNNVCCYCEILNAERTSPRFIYENKSFMAFAAWASIFPFEFWIMPKKHNQTLLQLRGEEIKDFAKTLSVCLRGLAKVLCDPPYNYGFHLAPPKMESEHFHWHLEVYPVLTTPAGLEKSFNMYVNVVQPEIAAEALREAIRE